MKFAISGKSGTGKTTLAGILAHYFNNDGYNVLAVDADPDANLASAIGIPADQSAQFGQLFKINPTVNDIADKYCTNFKGIKLLVMGGIQRRGNGCACLENVLLRKPLSELILNRDEVVIVDMQAGIEHLGRATAHSIDKMLIVVELSSRSGSTAKSIIRLGKEIGIESFGIVGNKI